MQNKTGMVDEDLKEMIAFCVEQPWCFLLMAATSFDYEFTIEEANIYIYSIGGRYNITMIRPTILPVHYKNLVVNGEAEMFGM